MVRGRIDGREFIGTGQKTICNSRGQNSIDSGTIHSCEEGKFRRVKGSSVV